MEVFEQRLHRWGPGPGATLNRIPNPNARAEVAADEGHLFHEAVASSIPKRRSKRSKGRP